MALALASSCRRVLLTGVAVLALSACETDLATETSPPAAPVVERSPRIASELVRGQEALATGDLQSAQAAFTAALRGSPNDPEPAIGLAETYLALGDLDTAGRLFELVSTRETGTQDARLLQGRGLVALRQGRTEEAIQLLEQSVDRSPAQWRAWAGLGRAYGRQGKSRQARTAFDRAEQVAPAPAAVINDIGMLHLEENDPASALAQFQRALAIDSLNVTASANARIARAMLRDYDAAISGARPEELPDVLNNVGYIAVMNGDFDVADRLLRRAIEVSPVFHESASANLDLLAQTKKGVPMPAVAEAGIPATEASEDVAATGVAGSARAEFAPVGATASGSQEAPTQAWAAYARESDNKPAAETIAAVTVPAAERPATKTGSGGFRWEPPSPEVAEAIARAQAARRAARAAAERERSRAAGDPRNGPWPAIVPSDAAATPAAFDPHAAGIPAVAPGATRANSQQTRSNSEDPGEAIDAPAETGATEPPADGPRAASGAQDAAEQSSETAPAATASDMAAAREHTVASPAPADEALPKE